ncbi:carbohydrate esterase family 1 protein [Xylaria grammica]|nr:carbohydrate esterase family 1 protein [Xylaria grammica]
MLGYKLGFTAAVVMLTASLGGVAAAKASSGCGKNPTLSGSPSTARTLTANGKSRTFYVNTPQNYDKDHPYRLILTLHALGGTASQVVAGTGGYYAWYGIPPFVNDTVNAIYVAPDGLNNGWANQGGEDVTFLSQLITSVEADLCVDQNLRFSTGFSYGGAMSYALACSMGQDIRAVAVLSGNPQISGCADGSKPVAYYGQHGVSDQVLPISGGREMRDRFIKNNGCTAQTAEEPSAGSGKYMKTTFSNCLADHPVVWVAFDGPHTPTPLENAAGKSFTPSETWAFFSQFK